MLHKIAKLMYWVIPIICLSLCPAVLLAQAASPEPQEKKAAKSSHTQTVTGCLQKGDEAGEFSITGEEKSEMKEGQMEKAAGKEEYADLNVTHLKMISETCSK